MFAFTEQSSESNKMRKTSFFLPFFLPTVDFQTINNLFHIYLTFAYLLVKIFLLSERWSPFPVTFGHKQLAF